MEHVKFCRPSLPNFSYMESLLKESMSSGHLSNFGLLYRKTTTELEKMFQLRGKGVVLTSSGHTALMTAYSVLGVKKLVVPDYTFVSTECAASLQGIDTIVVDVDIATGTLTAEILDSIEEEYDAVVLVCPLSIIPNLEEVHNYCVSNDKKLIIDGAATFGSSSSIYSYGDAYCMSFHATKTMSVGECGAVVINKDKMEEAETYITFGLSKEKNVLLTGINAKVSEYTCAVLLSLLDSIWGDIDRREQNAALYKEGLWKYMLPSWAPETIYTSFPIYVEGISNDIVSVLKNSNVQSLKYYKPLIGFPNSKKLFESNICLPSHPGVSQDGVKNIVSLVRKCISRSV